MADAAVDVSIIVPTYKQCAKLRHLLESVDGLVQPPAFELVIVDDCSPDDTETVVREWMSGAHSFETRYIRLPRNGGPAVARNRGVAVTRGPVVAFTDSDCRVDKMWLARLVKKLDPANNIVGAGGGVAPVNPNGLISRYCTIERILEPRPSLIYLVTANCCFLKDRLVEVGGFDEDVRTPGGEDIAVSIKMWNKGWRFAYDKEAIVYHDYNESVWNFIKTWRNYGFGCGYITTKYLGGFKKKCPVDPATAVDEVWRDNPIQPLVLKLYVMRDVIRTNYRKGTIAGLTFKQRASLVVLGLLQVVIHRTYWDKGCRAYRP